MAPFPVEKSGGFKPTLGHTVHKSADLISVIFEEVKRTTVAVSGGVTQVGSLGGRAKGLRYVYGVLYPRRHSTRQPVLSNSNLVLYCTRDEDLCGDVALSQSLDTPHEQTNHD